MFFKFFISDWINSLLERGLNIKIEIKMKLKIKLKYFLLNILVQIKF